jgi:hypothetical protein
MNSILFKIHLQVPPPPQLSHDYKVNPKSESSLLSTSSDLNKIKKKYTFGPHVHQLKTNMLQRINIKTSGCRTCGIK